MVFYKSKIHAQYVDYDKEYLVKMIMPNGWKANSYHVLDSSHHIIRTR